MRKIILSILAAFVSFVAPSAATAQSIQDIIGVAQIGSQLGFNPCSFTNQGSQRTFCQINRAANVANVVSQMDQRRRYRRSQEFNERTRQLEALQRACRAGDEQSCDRSGGNNPQQMQIARALMDACNAGDRNSCRRAEDMMDERNVSMQPMRQMEPMRPMQPLQVRPMQPMEQPQIRLMEPFISSTPIQGRNCSPEIDATTGYRIAGRFVCR